MSASDKKKAKPKGTKATMRKAPAPKISKTKKAPKVPLVEEEKPKKAAPKPKKATEEKKAPPKVIAKAEPLVLGPMPEAMVASRHIDSMHERPARGFSFGELASAGVPVNAARREGLSLDLRRRSVVEWNVEALKGWFTGAGKSASVKTAEEAVALAAAGKK